jgi:hypothetical protein
LWPNLLSLDAPLVASLWQNLFAHDAGVKISFAGRAALPLAVWLIYLTDRLFDTAQGRPMQGTARHEFSCAYRGLCRVLAALAAVLSFVSVFYLPLPVVRNGMVVLMVVGFYLLVVHGTGGSVRRWLPKEAAVGLIFSVGSVLAPATWSSTSARLVFPALLFGVLCWANSAAIEVWEGGRVDMVSAFVVRNLYLVALAVAVLSLLRGWWFPAEQAWVALLMAALGYAAVEYLRPEMSVDLRRVAIDIPLLTPVLFLVSHR